MMKDGHESAGEVKDLTNKYLVEIEYWEDGITVDGRDISSYYDEGTSMAFGRDGIPAGWKSLSIERWRDRLEDIIKACTAVSIMMGGGR